jgi:hypothetical protein
LGSLGLLRGAGDYAGGYAAGPLDGDFEIRSAFVVVDRGVLQLNAHVQYPINERIRTALQDGVTLAFRSGRADHQPAPAPLVEVPVLDMTLRRELTYHAVSDRYVLRNETARSRRARPRSRAHWTSSAASKILPILVESQLQRRGPWQVAVRAGVRRGRMSDACAR